MSNSVNSMQISVISLLLFCLVFAGEALGASNYSLRASQFDQSSHPITHSRSLRSPYSYRTAMGQWGEGESAKLLRREGFKIIDSQIQGNRGLDMIAVKIDERGKVTDLQFVESKTRHGGPPSLANTKNGSQGSRKWIAHKLRQMRNSKDPEVAALYRQISEYRRSLPDRKLSGRFRLITIDTKTGTISSSLAGKQKMSLSLVRHHLRSLASARNFSQLRTASRNLLHHARGYTSMSKYLAKSASRMDRKGVRRLFGQVHSRLASLRSAIKPRVVLRRVPVAGYAITLFLSAQDAYAFTQGDLTRSRLLRSGISAAGGTLAGLATGAAAGSFFGPLGTIIGGTLGAIGGTMAAEAAVDAYFSTLHNESLKSAFSKITIQDVLRHP